MSNAATPVKCRNRRPGKLHQATVSRPGKMPGVDIMGPFPRSTAGNNYLLFFVDYSYYLLPLGRAISSASGHCWNSLSGVQQRNPHPGSARLHPLRSGFPVHFISQFNTCNKWNLKQKKRTPYHPQTNLTETVNRNLKAMISSYVENKHKHWEKTCQSSALPSILLFMSPLECPLPSSMLSSLFMCQIFPARTAPFHHSSQGSE